MLLNSVLQFLALFWLVAAAEEFPKVEKLKTGYSFSIAVFDDSSVVLRQDELTISRSEDDGATWKELDIFSDEDERAAWFHIDKNYPGSRAFIYTQWGSAYMSDDQGKTWKTLNINNKKDKPKEVGPSCHITSHPLDKKLLLASCTNYDLISEEKGDHKKGNNPNGYVHTVSYISSDSGKNFKLIDAKVTSNNLENTISMATICKFGVRSADSILKDLSDTVYCYYTLTQRQNDENASETKDNGIKRDISKALRIVKGSISTRYRSIVTESRFFTISINNPTNPKIVKDLEGKTIEEIFVFNQQLMVLTIDDRYNNDSPKRIWISKDGLNFKESYLPTQLRFFISGEIKEDSTGRILLPITRAKNADSKRRDAITEFYLSDSRGDKFTAIPFLDYEAQGYSFFNSYDHLPGTMIGSFTSSRRTKSKENGTKGKHTSTTKITIDNGITWSNLKVVDPVNKKKFSCDIDDYENCSIHLIFGGFSSIVPTKGIIMVVGIVSDGSSMDWDDAKTFISRDGGQTWQLALEFATISTSGDYGNILMALPFDPEEDGDPESEFYYSLDQGYTWIQYQLEETIIPIELVSTTLDGSGSKFIIMGMTPSKTFSEKSNDFIYTIDFNDAFNQQKCKESDFELFSIANGECISGVKYTINRRKHDSKCLVRTTYTDLEWKKDVCEQCTDKDYECSYAFSKNENGKCVPDHKLLQLSGQCANAKNKEITLSPVQKIYNNKCKKELNYDDVKLSCDEVTTPGNSGYKITASENSIDAKIAYYKYFDTIADESLLIATNDNKVYVSHDGGETIKLVDIDSEILEISFNPYFNSTAYLFGNDGMLYSTHDRGQSFKPTKLPESRQLGLGLAFNANEPNQFIYFGGKNCKSIHDTNCHAVAYMTTDGGQTFTEMLDNAVQCIFANTIFHDSEVENRIFCMTLTHNSRGRGLVASNDHFKTSSVIFESIIGYMATGEFFVVAVPHGDDELKAFVTADGVNFAEASFPPDLKDVKKESFTVLGSETGSIFLHFAVNLGGGEDYGRLLKSNYNGTSFVSLEKEVNRNSQGFVDFEKIQGLEGIIIINTIGNVKQLENGVEKKKLKSKITFNDGADWSYIEPPSKDSQGKKYECSGKGIEKCSLHLHGYTERKDLRDTFSSGSAFGMMFGIGNVGEYLLPESESSTFLTTDGGVTWKEVKKGSYQWEYGDQGGILVLVASDVATDIISYSFDSGNTWTDYKFSGEKVIVDDIVTVPQDSSMRFLLIGKSSSFKGGTTKTYTIDFSGSFERQCVYDINNESTDDFDYISFNPIKNTCLFGHQVEYLKKNNNNCFVGSAPLADSFRITENCTCTRNDFECDYNYYKAKDGTCKLVEGLSPSDPSGICKSSPDVFEYFESTGYRKIPLSTCKGGLNLEGTSSPLPCPGKKDEFRKHHDINGFSFSALFMIPFLVIVSLAWIIYDRGIRRNGGFSRFGEIRLGDTLIEDNEVDRVVNSVVRSGFVASSSVMSGFEAIKRFFGKYINELRDRTSGRRGPSYTTLFNDQFLDDADDLLEGHDEDANDLNSLLNPDSNFDIDIDDDDFEFNQPFRDETENSGNDNTEEITKTFNDNPDADADVDNSPERPQPPQSPSPSN